MDKIKKLWWSVLLVVAVVVFFSSGILVGSEEWEKGFRDLEWKQSISETTEMKLRVKIDKLVLLYDRKGDQLTVYGIEVEAIAYSFYKGRFYEAVVFFKPQDSWKPLKGKIEATYGEGWRQPNSNKLLEVWAWVRKKSLVGFMYNKVNRRLELRITSKELNDLWRSERKWKKSDTY